MCVVSAWICVCVCARTFLCLNVLGGGYVHEMQCDVCLVPFREIATMTYRSGPEWGERFGRNRISDEDPSLCPTFVIENYLDYQGESFSTKFDPNSLLYISKVC